ncbi:MULTISPECIES: hypothetical protein [unclassified Flavobacterium]|uniref:hypothetical protein n=1 Tax=unclassified Flavobacterium TaxID=196869 RepID=UPI000F5065EC|nr:MULTISPECIES: hypothetical protein [unclassified Flavobacterium]MEA9413623.1 hypothetical protein [Flavobacterium sp. PL02]
MIRSLITSLSKNNKLSINVSEKSYLQFTSNTSTGLLFCSVNLGCEQSVSMSLKLFTTLEFIAKLPMGADNSTINSVVVFNSKTGEEQRFSLAVFSIELTQIEVSGKSDFPVVAS